MLGYSDSGKDAGRVAAAWALYGCQEQLVEVSRSTALRTCSYLLASCARQPLPAHASCCRLPDAPRLVHLLSPLIASALLRAA